MNVQHKENAMAHARVWDFPDWKRPTTVEELIRKPGIGYFPLSKNTVAVMHDAGGRLYVRKDTPIVPIAQPSWGRDWTVQASSSKDGVMLYIPARARTVITYHAIDGKYMPVAKVAQQWMSDPTEPEDALPLTTITGVTSAYGSAPVPLTRGGRVIGQAQVTWGDGAVTVEFLDTYGRAGTATNAGLVRGFTLGVSAKGTTVAVLEV